MHPRCHDARVTSDPPESLHPTALARTLGASRPRGGGHVRTRDHEVVATRFVAVLLKRCHEQLPDSWCTPIPALLGLDPSLAFIYLARPGCAMPTEGSTIAIVTRVYRGRALHEDPTS